MSRRLRSVSHRPVRIGYGRVCQETNAFSPVATTLEDFGRLHHRAAGDLAHACGRWGQEVPGLIRNAELSGFCRAARRHGRSVVEPVPLVSSWAMPSGPLDRTTCEELRSELLRHLRNVGELDGVLLTLHGAMRGSGDWAEPEERFLAAVRAEVGDDVPIAITLDLHGQLTPGKVDPVDILAGYRTNPHRDLARTGYRAGDLLIRAARGAIRPVSAWRSLPLVLGGGLTIDFLKPMRPVFSRMKAMERDPRVLYVSLFMAHVWNDSDELGWAVHVVTDDDPALAQRLAEELADRAWAERVHGPPRFLEPTEAIASVREARLARATGVVCVVDTSDVVGAGAAGENTNLLSALLEAGQGLTWYVPLRDEVAVAALWSREPGDAVELAVGGRLDPERNPVVELRGRLRRLAKTRYFGRAAVVDLGHVQLAITELAPFTVKPAFYQDLGLNPWRADAVVVKTLFHYRVYYAAVARKHVPVRTHGSTDLYLFENTKFQDPVHPLSEVEDWRPADRRRRGV